MANPDKDWSEKAEAFLDTGVSSLRELWVGNEQPPIVEELAHVLEYAVEEGIHDDLGKRMMLVAFTGWEKDRTEPMQIVLYEYFMRNLMFRQEIILRLKAQRLGTEKNRIESFITASRKELLGFKSRAAMAQENEKPDRALFKRAVDRYIALGGDYADVDTMSSMEKLEYESAKREYYRLRDKLSASASSYMPADDGVVRMKWYDDPRDFPNTAKMVEGVDVESKIGEANRLLAIISHEKGEVEDLLSTTISHKKVWGDRVKVIEEMIKEKNKK